MRIVKYSTSSTSIEGRQDGVPSEIFKVSEDPTRVYDLLLDEALSDLEIVSLTDISPFWKTLSTVVKDQVLRQLMNAGILQLVFDADHAPEVVLEYLAQIYGIQFPEYYTLGQRRLLLKYFPNFLKYKGIPQYALEILQLIDREEDDLYRDSYSEAYTILPFSNGLYVLELSPRIKSIDLAYSVIDRVTTEGMYYGVPTDGPLVVGSATDRPSYSDDRLPKDPNLDAILTDEIPEPYKP